jgi:energy-coupling factor transport system substrate-specific component
MNLWFWPFLAASPELIYSSIGGLSANLQRYSAYYLATSLVWDVTRAVGNVLIISVLSKPVLKIFQRFQLRFSFHHMRIKPS